MKIDASKEFNTIDSIIERLVLSVKLTGDEEVLVDLASHLFKRGMALLEDEVFDDVEAFLKELGLQKV